MENHTLNKSQQNVAGLYQFLHDLLLEPMANVLDPNVFKRHIKVSDPISIASSISKKYNLLYI